MGLPLFRRRIRGSTRHQDLSYKVTPGDEVEDMFILLNEVKRQIPSVAAVSSGAIASDYQRLRVESVCARLGLVSLAYLWKQDQTFLLEEMIQRGIIAITIKVAAMGLNPSRHLGKELSHLQPYLLQMKELYGINVCGEGGEYETLTLDCPLFTNARIVLDKFHVILHSPDSIAPVGVLHPLAFHLEHKSSISSLSSSNANIYDGLEKLDHIYEVQGDGLQSCLVKCQPMSLAGNSDMANKSSLCISTFERDTFSVGCWSQSSSKSSEGLWEDLTTVLRRIESQLSKDGFDWANVLYIHLYISDMKQFALANEVYVRFITEKKCHLGVPSRSTVELPLHQARLGNAYVEVLVANDQSKRVLHVQSISCWAPSCIGPYSQATLHKEVLYMAGQLGLDPPTMTLCAGGAVAEMEKALENSEAVANCFNSSISSSAIIFVIYCSASLSSSEKIKLQSIIDHFLRERASNPQKESLLIESNPIFLYVLSPGLPKGALVEVKPVLYVPENREDEDNLILPPTVCTEIPNYWGFEYSNIRDLCCQIYTIRGKACTALISITKEIAASICFEADQSIESFQCYGSEIHMKSIAKLCIYLLDGILVEKNFSWREIIHLRLYFAWELSVTADVLSHIFSEILNEFRELTGRIDMNKEPIFSIIPVLGSGRSASMEDIVTCELFATKS
ncbi:diphthine--ammonia ligase isoform X2 [Asparagus officinalis]|nr:diphthine--ammonia ligase isoform X2 [Asparagus officinalis]